VNENRQNGKTLAQLRAAAAYRTEHPDRVVMFVCGTQVMVDYAKRLAEHHGLADGLSFVNVTSAARKARGTHGMAFIDHAAFERRMLDLGVKHEALQALRHMNERATASQPSKGAL
jgi:hypothetical protein